MSYRRDGETRLAVRKTRISDRNDATSASEPPNHGGRRVVQNFPSSLQEEKCFVMSPIEHSTCFSERGPAMPAIKSSAMKLLKNPLSRVTIADSATSEVRRRAN